MHLSTNHTFGAVWTTCKSIHDNGELHFKMHNWFILTFTIIMFPFYRCEGGGIMRQNWSKNVEEINGSDDGTCEWTDRDLSIQSELIGEVDQFHQIMSQPVTSSSEKDQSDIQYNVPNLQPPITQSTQEEEVVEILRSRKIRNVQHQKRGTGYERVERGVETISNYVFIFNLDNIT